jgi:Na+-driven multidrug efflux pump
MLIGGLIIFISSSHVMKFFSNDTEIIYYGTTYLKVAAIAGPCYPIFYITSALLQGLKKPTYALVINLLRMIMIPIIILGPAVIIYKISYLQLFVTVLVINYIFSLLILLFAKNLIAKKIKNYKPNLTAV